MNDKIVKNTGIIKPDRFFSGIKISQVFCRSAFILFIFLVSLHSFSQVKTASVKPVSEIAVHYTDSLYGEFEFTKKWSYSTGIYKNDQGQVRCDGNCPPEIDRMKDGSGNIREDSLHAYFSLLDTTHYYHTIESEASAYEYAGTNYINCFKNASGFINCYTMNNAATHSSLRISLNGDKCIPGIFLTPVIKNSGNKIFKCNSGSITIDRANLSRGYLKAEFDFTFINTTGDGKKLYWKGKIYTAITEF